VGAAVRGLLVVAGVLAMVGGLLLIVSGSPLALPGLQAVAVGAFLVIVVTIERSRYRSEHAERSNATPGPGGGEPAGGQLEPRFRPTAEVFIDPTTGLRMRVVVDPASGERRYVAEG
jgi:UPF0716 family protein affecting phage T7 exclusion